MAAHSGPGFTGDTQTLTTSAAEIVGADSHPRRVFIKNISAGDVFVGGNTGAALTTSNGYEIAAEGELILDLPPFAELFGIAGSSLEIRFMVQDGVQAF